MGNPGVFQGYPYPYPFTRVGVLMGWGFQQPGDKGCFGSYMKPYDLILLSMILQLE